MNELLPGKVVIVTGSGRGIGRCSAVAFAREGAKVVVSDVTVKDGEETVDIIKKDGGEAIFVKADVTSEEDVKKLMNKTVETFGRIDCAHNNAGIMGDQALIADCTAEIWDKVMNVNLRSMWLCMKYEIPIMLKQGGGAIVNTSSTAGLIGVGSGYSAYVASKHGVLGLTKAGALEYGQQGIRVNAVCPGTTLTPMVILNAADKPEVKAYLDAGAGMPLGRVGQPEEIAEAVVWLCSDRASFVLGHGMVVDGGRVIP